jgi:hypothetical protein
MRGAPVAQLAAAAGPLPGAELADAYVDLQYTVSQAEEAAAGGTRRPGVRHPVTAEEVAELTAQLDAKTAE